MATRMLIDAAHQEETRVVVVTGERLEEFDFESSAKKQLKGNIYLAKVTRVEPSLQAAFVEYGGNRDGFLPFGEIHPDYYQIPVADRRALIAQEAAENKAAQEEAEAESEGEAALDAEAAESEDNEEHAVDGGETADDDGESSGDPKAEADAEATTVETVGGDDLEEESPRSRKRPSRPYKIQEVIKRRQILLVQVVKEERGNKGAALTTYLSLAGRYCVLMPNTERGGGISRKIVSNTDRKRLRDMIDSLSVPAGMGVIIRTAGMNRNKPEIKRDFEYLIRLWDEIRETTLNSIAPALVYEEANLIKRSIRDLYSKDIQEILVEGDEGYRSAKDFMRNLMPSRAKVVQPYRDEVPLFHRYRVEEQFDGMYSPVVNLKSGGYIVINATEALVAIDVNSGRSTKERNIEDTALATNLEAAAEVARQVRLRDLSGLIVVDFIDMESSRNNRAVERKLKEALKQDRARLQVGRISPFGLLEMSRQRLRPSLIEASGERCRVCGGTGMVRSTESSVLHALRAIEEAGIRGGGGQLNVYVATQVALYLLNYKRAALRNIEQRYELSVYVHGDEALAAPEYRLVRSGDGRDEEVVKVDESRSAAEGEGADGKKQRRPRRRKRDQDESGKAASAAESGAQEEEPAEAAERGTEEADKKAVADEEAEAPRKRRRRGKRGGRRRSRGARSEEAASEATADDSSASSEGEATAAEAEAPGADGAPGEAEPAEKRKRGGRRRGKGREARKSEAPEPEAKVDEVAAEEAAGAVAELGDEEAAAGAPDEVVFELPVAETPVPAQAEVAEGEPDEPAAEPAPPIASRHEESEEPAPFVTVPDEDMAPVLPQDEASKPASRRGWWRKGMLS